MRTALALLTAIAPIAAVAQTAPASAPQPQTAPTQRDEEDEEEVEGADVVVTGARNAPGAVVGDIPPEISLNAADVRSYGVSSISELLSELTPQTTSGRGQGGQPVVLLNGRRVSSFREIANVPTEAILRVEVLPEEVALKYGYRADQRVVNFVLRRRFRAIAVELADRLATDGGRNAGEVELDLVQIARDARTTLHVERNAATALTESERDITTGLIAPVGANGVAIDQTRFRTLLPQTSDFTFNAVHARPLGRAQASLNGSVATTSSVGSFGLPVLALTTPTGTIQRAIDAGAPLSQRSSTLTTHLGSTVNGDARSVALDGDRQLRPRREPHDHRCRRGSRRFPSTAYCRRSDCQPAWRAGPSRHRTRAGQSRRIDVEHRRARRASQRFAVCTACRAGIDLAARRCRHPRFQQPFVPGRRRHRGPGVARHRQRPAQYRPADRQPPARRARRDRVPCRSTPMSRSTICRTSAR